MAEPHVCVLAERICDFVRNLEHSDILPHSISNSCLHLDAHLKQQMRRLRNF